MKRNIRYIFLTMTVAIIGILIFQIYWISNTYDIERHSFEQEVNDALQTVLKEDITDKTLQRIFGVNYLSQDSLVNLIKNSERSTIASKDAERQNLSSNKNGKGSGDYS
ncbi:MAG: hypothetical protein J7L96_05175, partial [Bacteroidales bacterium]|nr:hypothetical protein [Bacteroidales bacterium]